MSDEMNRILPIHYEVKRKMPTLCGTVYSPNMVKFWVQNILS